MCLAIPGRIEELLQQDGMRMARVDFGGVRRITCIEYALAATVGDYVLVHVGFAISVIDETEAKRQYEALRMSGELSEAESAMQGEGP
jgi:hydrogenase expression/formation protein HypC